MTDTLRTTQPEWITDARESLYRQQEMVVENLEEKVNNAPEEASDEFMYQGKEEAEQELKVAKKIFDDIRNTIKI